MYCKYCNKECKNNNSLRNHTRLCKLNPDYLPPPPKTAAWYEAIKTKTIRGTYHNGATKAKSQGREWVVSEDTKTKHRETIRNNPISFWTDERRAAHSIVMRAAVLNNPDSYCKDNVVGRVKNIDHNGIKVKGSWEKLIAEKLDSADIKWTNEIAPFNYHYEDKWHLYFPDFYLPEHDLYIEVKGYERERDRAKWSVVNNLQVLRNVEIKKLKAGTDIKDILF